MKFTLGWLKDYLDTSASLEQIVEGLLGIGLEVEAVEDRRKALQPFTVAYVKGEEQLFRARFGGFADQDAAVRACKVLKKQGMGCWASLQ